MKAWSPDRDAALLRLWGEGLLASRIAQRLGGTTRNDVISRLHRLLPIEKGRRIPDAAPSDRSNTTKETARA